MPPKISNFRVRRWPPSVAAGAEQADSPIEMKCAPPPLTTDRRLQADLVRPRGSTSMQSLTGNSNGGGMRRSSALPPLHLASCQSCSAGGVTGVVEACKVPVAAPSKDGSRVQSASTQQPRAQQQEQQKQRAFMRPMAKLQIASKPSLQPQQQQQQQPSPNPASSDSPRAKQHVRAPHPPREAPAYRDADSPCATGGQVVVPAASEASRKRLPSVTVATVIATSREDAHSMFRRGVTLLNAALGRDPQGHPRSNLSDGLHSNSNSNSSTYRCADGSGEGVHGGSAAGSLGKLRAVVAANSGGTVQPSCSGALMFQTMVAMDDNSNKYGISASTERRQRVLRTVPLLPLWLITDGAAVLLVDFNGTHKHRNHSDAATSAATTSSTRESAGATLNFDAMWFADSLHNAHVDVDGSLRIPIANASAAVQWATTNSDGMDTNGSAISSSNSSVVALPPPAEGLRGKSLTYGSDPLLLLLPASSPIAAAALADIAQAYLPTLLESAYPDGVPLRGLWLSSRARQTPLWQRQQEQAVSVQCDGRESIGQGELGESESVTLERDGGAQTPLQPQRATLGHLVLPPELTDALVACGAVTANAALAPRKSAPAASTLVYRNTVTAGTTGPSHHTAPLKSTGPLAATARRPYCCLTVTVLMPTGRLLLQRQESYRQSSHQQQQLRLCTGKDVREAVATSAEGHSLGLKESGFDLIYAPGSPPLRDVDLIDTTAATLRLVRHAPLLLATTRRDAS